MSSGKQWLEVASEEPEAMIRAALAGDANELDAACAQAAPDAAVLAVCAAPTLQAKSDILWALDDPRRRLVLDAVPSALIAALIQNLEEDNRYLLGDLKIAKFRDLLSLCRPERRCYWLITALSFTDVRANALPLFLSPEEMAEAFLTRQGFAAHVRSIADFPIEAMRIPPEMMADPAQAIVDYFGVENLLRQFPAPDDALGRILQNLLDFHAEAYVDLLRASLKLLDYRDNHPLEHEALLEDPVLVSELPPPARTSMEAAEPETVGGEQPVLQLVPVRAQPLTALMAEVAEPAQRARIAGELQMLYVRQAIAEGGSFAEPDLLRVARAVDATLVTGLLAEAGDDPRSQARLLAARPLNKISHSGAREVERLRQAALRLFPLRDLVTEPEAALLASLRSPLLELDDRGAPSWRLKPAPGLPSAIPPAEAWLRVRRITAWVALTRELGLTRVRAALSAERDVSRLRAELALGAILFGRIEIGLAESGDLARLKARYKGEWSAARQSLDAVLDPQADPAGVAEAPLPDLLWDELQARLEAS